MTRLGADSFMTGFVGHLFSLLPLLLFILLTQGREGLKISKKGLVFAVIMGIVTKGFFKLTYDTTISTVGLSTGAVLLYTSPVFVGIMSSVFFKEKLRINNYIALIMNLVGVFLMVSLGNLSALNVAPLGIVLGLTAGFLYALNTIMAKLATSGDHPVTTTFYMLVFSTITQGLVARPWLAHNMNLLTNNEFLFWAVLCAIVTGVLANVFYLSGLSTQIDASKAPVISSVEVIVATLMGVLVFREPMNAIGVFGGILMIASIFLMNMKPAEERAKKPVKETVAQPDGIEPAA